MKNTFSEELLLFQPVAAAPKDPRDDDDDLGLEDVSYDEGDEDFDDESDDEDEFDDEIWTDESADEDEV